MVYYHCQEEVTTIARNLVGSLETQARVHQRTGRYEIFLKTFEKPLDNPPTPCYNKVSNQGGHHNDHP